MKRDNDLLRELLMEIEASDEPDFYDDSEHAADEAVRRTYHLKLLTDAGLLIETQSHVYRLTNAGHDFLEAMRDEGIWTRTKAAVAESGGNATLEIFKQIAVGFLKKSISDRTGIDL